MTSLVRTSRLLARHANNSRPASLGTYRYAKPSITAGHVLVGSSVPARYISQTRALRDSKPEHPIPPPPAEGEPAVEHRQRSTTSGPPTSLAATQFTTGSTLIDAAITTVIGLGMVFFGGIAYVSWYKSNVLDKMEQAFSAGYDPALELASRSKKAYDKAGSEHDGPWTEHLRRKEQDEIDRIVGGKETGHYWMLLGPKGTGKTTMLYDAMANIHAEGVSICEAHPDLEVFRLRLGKALNFEFHEDSQTGLFQRRDPREGGPALDLERALNKLEKVALRYSERTGRPLVLILNNVHFFKNDEDGKNVLLQFQQHAEAWAQSGILTMIFSSDDSWPYSLMRKTGSRMRVKTVCDLSTREAIHASQRMRIFRKFPPEDDEVFKQVINMVGGRLSYLGKVTKHRDMVSYARHMLDIEKNWLQSQIGLIPDHDDDVMDEQKWSSCSWLLLREFVKIRQEQEREVQNKIDAGEASSDEFQDLPLPKVSYYRARQIMTRTDFLDDLDNHNIIAIDTHHDVTPDSQLLLQAAREVVEEEGFDDMLDEVRDRVDDIESLHRTRELTFKDLAAGDKIRLSVDKSGGRLV